MNSLHSTTFLIAIISSFGMGLLASLTPCVYPLIPITLSIFGARQEKSRKKAFLLSFSYVSGIALTYTLLGVVTVKLGMVFGTILGNPFVVIPACGILLLLALSSLGVFSIPVGNLQTKATKIGGAGYVGAFAMGAVSGGVAAPCVGPVLAILLVEVAQSQDLIRGVLMLLAYSFGLGTPFLLLGTFSSMINVLPRSGNWLQYVKLTIAACLIGEIIFLLMSLFPETLSFSFSSALWVSVLMAGVFSGVFAIRQSKKMIECFSCVCLAISVTQLAFASSASKINSELAWLADEKVAMVTARDKSQPIMIDLYARWCVACKELDHTFNEAKVSEQIKKRLVPVRIDFTAESDNTKIISEKYGVIGLPCVLFLRPDGTEIQEARITGKVSPEEFLKNLEKL